MPYKHVWAATNCHKSRAFLRPPSQENLKAPPIKKPPNLKSYLNVNNARFWLASKGLHALVDWLYVHMWKQLYAILISCVGFFSDVKIKHIDFYKWASLLRVINIRTLPRSQAKRICACRRKSFSIERFKFMMTGFIKEFPEIKETCDILLSWKVELNLNHWKEPSVVTYLQVKTSIRKIGLLPSELKFFVLLGRLAAVCSLLPFLRT